MTPPSLPAPSCTYTLMSGALLMWADADAACQAAGLQLASVQSAEQNTLLLAVAYGNNVWIGGTDAASEGTWVWSGSNTPLSYTNWADGEPNNYYSRYNLTEDCLELYSSGEWNDQLCGRARKYVCQTACPVPRPSPSPHHRPRPPRRGRRPRRRRRRRRRRRPRAYG